MTQYLFQFIPTWLKSFIEHFGESEATTEKTPLSFAEFVSERDPQLLEKLNCRESFVQMRLLLEEYGVERFYKTEKVKNRHLFDQGSLNVSLSKDVSIPAPAPHLPFTFFYTMESENGPLQQFIPERMRYRFALVTNLPHLGGTGPGEGWSKAKNMENGSMSMFHQFLVVRDLDASLFNALTFGLPLPHNGWMPSPKTANEDVFEMLCDMEQIALLWAEKNGIPSEDLGCFFHVYPKNSIPSLHMHMVDCRELSRGKAWSVNEHKNLPLADLQQYFAPQTSLLHG